MPYLLLQTDQCYSLNKAAIIFKDMINLATKRFIPDFLVHFEEENKLGYQIGSSPIFRGILVDDIIQEDDLKQKRWALIRNQRSWRDQSWSQNRMDYWGKLIIQEVSKANWLLRFTNGREENRCGNSESTTENLWAIRNREYSTLYPTLCKLIFQISLK